MKATLKHTIKSQRLILLAFLVLHIALVYACIANRNLCLDEADYYYYSVRWLKGEPKRMYGLDDSKSPMVVMATIPRIVKQLLNPNYHVTDYGYGDVGEGRYLMGIYSILCLLYLYKWSTQLFGNQIRWPMMLLFLFDPLVLSYAGMVTSDLACGFFLLATMYHTARYYETGKRKQFLLASILAGLCAVTKQGLLYAVPLLAVISMILFVRKKNYTVPAFRRFFGKGLLAVAIILFVMNACYYFDHSFMPLGSYHFESHSFNRLQAQFSFLSRLPVPLPQNYVLACDLLKLHAETGAATPESTYDGLYIAGAYKRSGSFWYYYPVAAVFKFPLVSILILITSLIAGIAFFSKTIFFRKYIFVTLPVVWFSIVLSLFNPFQTGVRHLLVIVPLAYLACGYGLVFLTNRLKLRLFSYVAMAYLAFSLAFYYPFFIPYTNELLTDKKTVYRKICDSSIDYGQSDSVLTTFLQLNPQLKPAPVRPDTGWFIITDKTLVNHKFYHHNPYEWLKKYEPVGQYQFVHLIYHITGK